MRSWRRTAPAILVIAVVVALAGCAAGRGSTESPLTATLERDAVAAQLAERIQLSDDALADLVPATSPGCSAAFAEEGTVVWAGAAGLADLEQGTPLTIETRFDIASVAKQFTATAILMLQRDGLLSVSDPIGNYVDDLPDWGETVTLDQLIHHTSRIEDFWVELDDEDIGFTDPADQATTVAAIARETELNTEGTGYFYSNSNYVLLAEVVQRVSGQPLPDFLATRVFGPLGLDNDRRSDAGWCRHRATLRRHPRARGGRLDRVRPRRHHHDAVRARAVGRPVPGARGHGRAGGLRDRSGG